MIAEEAPAQKQASALKAAASNTTADLIPRLVKQNRTELLHGLRLARNYLCVHGNLALAVAGGVATTAGWGSAVKRTRVQLPVGGRPAFVNADVVDHSLAEVINQCATLDRLIDAVEWSQRELASFDDVMICHPTTSSSKKEVGGDNDLILRAPDGSRCRFEASDVASPKDGNGKEESDLISLGALAAGKADQKLNVAWPADRLFLVVSTEFAAGVLRRQRLWIKKNHFTYSRHQASDMTVILEVCRPSAGEQES